MSEEEKKREAVDHPRHYTRTLTLFGFEVIDATELLPNNLGNAVKYLLRAGEKDPREFRQDLQKAEWYANREVQRQLSDFEDSAWKLHSMGTEALNRIYTQRVPLGSVGTKDEIALEFIRDFIELDAPLLLDFHNKIHKLVAELPAEPVTAQPEGTPVPDWAVYLYFESKSARTLAIALEQFKELCRVEGVRDGYAQAMKDHGLDRG